MVTAGYCARGFTCNLCDEPVDPIRAAVRVSGSQVVRLCRSCSAGPARARPALGLERERVVVTALVPPARQPGAARMPASSRRRTGLLAIGLVLVALAPVAVVVAGGSQPVLAAALAIDPALLRPRPRVVEVDATDDLLALLAGQPLVEGDGWIHPIAGSDEQVPTRPPRLFRAWRAGDRPRECGRGHCGVDLDAPRGSPIVAVRPGVVVKVEYSRHAQGGRYVWIGHHAAGLETRYFHLDEIAADLRAGDAVEAGQWLGTLGQTGIHSSEPHLHFAVLDLRRGGRYVDPEPLLAAARIIHVLDLRLPIIDRVPLDPID